MVRWNSMFELLFPRGLQRWTEPIPFSLANFQSQYRITRHATTAAAPSSLFLGRKLRTKLDFLHLSLERQVRDRQVSRKLKHDIHDRQRVYENGDGVMARNFRPGPRWIPGRVCRTIGLHQYLVRMQDGNMWRRNIDHLRFSLRDVKE